MNILIGLVKSTNAVFANVLQSGMSDMGMDAFGEKEQGQELADPALTKSRRDAVASMTHDTSSYFSC